MTASPASVLEKRKFFLEALGVIAKQPSGREPITKASQGSIPGQMGTGGTSLAPSAVSSAAKVASDLTTVYDLGKLSSPQQEGKTNYFNLNQSISLSQPIHFHFRVVCCIIPVHWIFCERSYKIVKALIRRSLYCKFQTSV